MFYQFRDSGLPPFLMKSPIVSSVRILVGKKSNWLIAAGKNVDGPWVPPVWIGLKRCASCRRRSLRYLWIRWNSELCEPKALIETRS